MHAVYYLYLIVTLTLEHSVRPEGRLRLVQATTHSTPIGPAFLPDRYHH